MATDDIGERAQSLFVLLISDFRGRDKPLFRPRFLGDKFPTFDYLIELVDHPNSYFFVQVKGTIQSYTIKESRLKVQLSQKDVDRMVSFPAPTYLVGIDSTLSELGYIVSVNELRDHFASLPTRNLLDSVTLRRLYDEVRIYWASRDMILRASCFKEVD